MYFCGTDLKSDMSFYSLLIALLFCCGVFGSSRKVTRQTESNSCTTPGNKLGTCVRLDDCSDFIDILENETFSKNSLCGREKNGKPKFCCNLDPRASPQALKTPSPPIRIRCGYVDAQTLISRDQAVLPGEVPWIVALGYRRAANSTIMWRCSGSLISDRWILTAAHCTQGIGSLILTTARMGDINLNDTIKDLASPIDKEIDKIIPHPQYQISPTANDIALLRLKDPIDFIPKSVSPICVPKGTEEFKSDNFYTNNSGEVAGWGHSRGFQQSGATVSDWISNTFVNIVELQVCEEKYKSKQIKALIDNRVLCAMRTKYASCRGDSGGPLMMQMDDGISLIGIESFGIDCKNGTFPGVYTRVAAFADWIRSTTGLKLE